MSTPSVTRVEALEGHRLRIDFSNGETGLLDVKPWLDFGVFQRLRDPEAFRRVKVAWDTVEWDCGPDLDPELVYARAEKTKDPR